MKKELKSLQFLFWFLHIQLLGENTIYRHNAILPYHSIFCNKKPAGLRMKNQWRGGLFAYS